MASFAQHLPEAVLTYNAAGAPGDPIDSGDLISIEGHAPEYVRQSFNARWAKMRGKPFEISDRWRLAARGTRRWLEWL